MSGAITPNDVADARAMVKAVFDDGEAEINGRKYVLLKMTHKQRRKVFAYYTKVSKLAENNDLSFIDSSEFEPVELLVHGVVSYNDSLLSKLGDSHWEKYPEDYVTFIMTVLPAMSYPFMVAAPTS